MENLKFGLIGSGDVARALGWGLVGLGHPVVMGTREPGNPKAAEWASQAGPLASAGTFADAARADVVILATLWSGTENALRLAGHEHLAGKVLIDATNPLTFGADGPSLTVGHTDSGGETVQRWVPGARVVKAFNIVGNAHMVKPDFPGGPPDMLIAGDDAEAKKLVTALCTALGWGTVDAGGIAQSRLLEPLALIWIRHYFTTGNGNHAFKLLRK